MWEEPNPKSGRMTADFINTVMYLLNCNVLSCVRIVVF